MRLARRLLLTTAILGGLFWGANVLAERVAESRIAAEAQKSFGTPAPPEVSIEGFPILIKILQGQIPRVTLEGSGLVVQEMKVARLRIVDQFHGPIPPHRRNVKPVPTEPSVCDQNCR